MKLNIQTMIKFAVGIVFFVILMSDNSFGQNCPTFQIKEVKDVGNENNLGSVIVGISASKLYRLENFEIRQKENEVTGPIGYEVEINITRNELIISGLKKSEELYLNEYVILFSDQSCKNSEIVEVGTFKIK